MFASLVKITFYESLVEGKNSCVTIIRLQTGY